MATETALSVPRLTVLRPRLTPSLTLTPRLTARRRRRLLRLRAATGVRLAPVWSRPYLPAVLLQGLQRADHAFTASFRVARCHDEAGPLPCPACSRNGARRTHRPTARSHTPGAPASLADIRLQSPGRSHRRPQLGVRRRQSRAVIDYRRVA